MTIDEMRDALAEARRYARPCPAAAVRLAERVRDALDDRFFDARGGALGSHWDRLRENLGAGVAASLADPEAFASACYLVSHELLCMKGDV